MLAEAIAPQASVLDFVGDWYLVSVKPQKEERMADELRRKGVQVFLPRERVLRTYEQPNGKIVKRAWDRLAWTGYLFVCGDPSVQYAIWDSLWNIGSKLISDSERLIGFLHVYEQRYMKGSNPIESRGLYVRRPVLIVGGPLREADGRPAVIEKIDGNRVWVTTLLLGDIRTVEIEHLDYLETI